MKLALVIVLVGALGACLGDHAKWAYDGAEGPQHWQQQFQQCGERKQSPVNIQTSRVQVENFPVLQLHHYDTIRMAEVSDNGHTAILTLPVYSKGLHPSISGGGLDGLYILEQFHFHWGQNDTVGSEHTIDDKSFASEMHIVHYKSKYDNFSHAVAYSDGLAVLAVFIQVSVNNNSVFDPIIQHLRYVQHADEHSLIPEPLNFHGILPEATNDFYRYSGSLTTPPCSEIVTWTLFRTPVTMSSSQLAEFRKLTDVHGQNLLNNDRPVQPINDRTIYVSSGAIHPLQSALFSIVCLTFVLKI